MLNDDTGPSSESIILLLVPIVRMLIQTQLLKSILKPLSLSTVAAGLL